MRRDFVVEAGKLNGMAKRGAHGLDRLAIPFDEGVANDALGDPPAHVSKQARRDWYRRLPFLCRSGTVCQTIKDAAFNVDKRSPDAARDRGRRDRAGTRAGVEADQDESCQVPERAA